MRGWRVDWCCPSHKDLDNSTYFPCLCQFGNIMLSPLIGASLTSNAAYIVDGVNPHGFEQKRLSKFPSLPLEWHDSEAGLFCKCVHDSLFQLLVVLS